MVLSGWSAGLLAVLGTRLHTRSALLSAVPGRFVKCLARCIACGRVPLNRGGGVFSPRPPGDVIAFEVRLVRHREGCSPCLLASCLRLAARGNWRWVSVGGTPAGLHEGIEEVLVVGVSAGRPPLVSCALRCVGCGCPGYGLRVGLSWALCQRLPGRCVPRRACVAAVCRGRGWGGAHVSRGLCPVGGWWWGAAARSAPGVGPPGPVPRGPASGTSLLSRAALSGGRLAGVLACWLLVWPVPR